MTGVGKWQAGHELICTACSFHEIDAYGEPVCVIAQECAVSGETMTANVCPDLPHPAHTYAIRKRHAQRARYDAALATWRNLDHPAVKP